MREQLFATLQLAFAGYWRSGSGRGSGYHLDSVCERDEAGLPLIPGRQLKGVLRHALARCEEWGWLEDIKRPEGPASSWEALLFGSLNSGTARAETLPGMLTTASARLPDEERLFLAAPSNGALRDQLFESLFNTAVDDNGTARSGSLRGAEVALPVTLSAGLTMSAAAVDHKLRQQQAEALDGIDAWIALRACLPIIDAVGAGRSRGLGEVTLELVTHQPRELN